MIEKFLMNSDLLQMIVFNIGAEEYGIPIMSVQEIIMPQHMTKIPKTPEFIEGVLNLRGKIIPIIDAKKKFNVISSNPKDESRVIVMNVTTGTIGLIVDAVTEVVHLNINDLESPPLELEGDNDVILGIGKINNRLIIILNSEKFLTGNEAQTLYNITKIAREMTADVL